MVVGRAFKRGNSPSPLLMMTFGLNTPKNPLFTSPLYSAPTLVGNRIVSLLVGETVAEGTIKAHGKWSG